MLCTVKMVTMIEATIKRLKSAWCATLAKKLIPFECDKLWWDWGDVDQMDGCLLAQWERKKATTFESGNQTTHSTHQHTDNGTHHQSQNCTMAYDDYLCTPSPLASNDFSIKTNLEGRGGGVGHGKWHGHWRPCGKKPAERPTSLNTKVRGTASATIDCVIVVDGRFRSGNIPIKPITIRFVSEQSKVVKSISYVSQWNPNRRDN